MSKWSQSRPHSEQQGQKLNMKKSTENGVLSTFYAVGDIRKATKSSKKWLGGGTQQQDALQKAFCRPRGRQKQPKGRQVGRNTGFELYFGGQEGAQSCQKNAKLSARRALHGILEAKSRPKRGQRGPKVVRPTSAEVQRDHIPSAAHKPLRWSGAHHARSDAWEN